MLVIVPVCMGAFMWCARSYTYFIACAMLVWYRIRIHCITTIKEFRVALVVYVVG